MWGESAAWRRPDPQTVVARDITRLHNVSYSDVVGKESKKGFVAGEPGYVHKKFESEESSKKGW